MTPRPAAHAMPWWSTPAGLAFGFQLPVLSAVAWAGNTADGAGSLTIRAIRFLSVPYLVLALALILAWALAGLIGTRLRASNGPADDGDGWEAVALAIGWIALPAYVLWFKDYLFNPPLLFQLLTGAFNPARDDSARLPGITSLVNVAPVFFSIYAYNHFVAGRRSTSRAVNAMALALTVFTLFRVYAWSERLALIEAAVPVGLAAAVGAMRRRGIVAWVVRVGGPYAAMPALILFFGIAEFSRSWSSDTYNGKSDFWTFVIGRMTTYYYTSLNNGAGMLSTSDWPTFKFEFVLRWLHDLPVLGHLFSALVGTPNLVLTEFLSRGGDPEFNNPSGLYAIVVDLGVPGALIYLGGLGLVAGMTQRAYAEGRLAGVLLYPLLFISALEFCRYPYLGEPRAFTWMMGVALALLFRRRRSAAGLPARSAPAAAYATGLQEGTP